MEQSAAPPQVSWHESVHAVMWQLVVPAPHCMEQDPSGHASEHSCPSLQFTAQLPPGHEKSHLPPVQVNEQLPSLGLSQDFVQSEHV